MTYFKNKFKEYSKCKGDNVKLLIIDGESLNNIDSSTISVLQEIVKYFDSKNIEVVFTDIKGTVRDKIELSGFTKELGRNHFLYAFKKRLTVFIILV